MRRSVLAAIVGAAAVGLATACSAGVAGSGRGMAAADAPTAPRPIDNQAHLYVLDGWGGVHPVGDSPELPISAAWPYQAAAISLALFPDGLGGYVLDAWGGLHPIGDAPALSSGVAWTETGIAREVVLAPWASAGNPAGYVLDAWGAVHSFGGAPAMGGSTFRIGDGLARGLVITPGSTPEAVMGYTLDGHGGIHPLGSAPAVFGAAAWPDLDEARGIVLVPAQTTVFVQGYTLDGHGGIHAFGGAPQVMGTAAWASDTADSITAWTGAPAGSPGGWVLDRHGGVHAFGSAPELATSFAWPSWDIARGLAGSGSGAGSYERRMLEPETATDAWGTYYNQRDVRWGAHAVGASSHQVWEVGCLLVDLAMVYTHFGFGSVTPANIAAHSGWFTGGGGIYNSALHVPGHATLINWSPSRGWISAMLAAGHPVVVGMNLDGGGTHFVTLTGLDGPSDYWTDDPWEQNAIHVPFSGEWSDRGPIFEAIAFI